MPGSGDAEGRLGHSASRSRSSSSRACFSFSSCIFLHSAFTCLMMISLTLKVRSRPRMGSQRRFLSKAAPYGAALRLENLVVTLRRVRGTLRSGNRRPCELVLCKATKVATRCTETVSFELPDRVINSFPIFFNGILSTLISIWKHDNII